MTERQSEDSPKNTYRFNVEMTPTDVGLMNSFADEYATKSEAFRAALRTRKRIKELSAEDVVLAKRDSSGNLVEFGPLSILE